MTGNFITVPAPITNPLIVIPAIDEAETVGAVVAAVRVGCPDCTILVVDDGSTDDTAALASRAGALVASHAVNLGVGGAMRTGFQYAFRNGHDAVVQVDGDGQHPESQIGILLEGLESSDIVIGARFGSDHDYPIGFVRRLAIRILSRAVSIHCKTRLTDVTSGFRAAGPRAIRLFASHYPIEYLGDTVESLVLAGKVGLTIREVPVAMEERRSGRPSQSPFAATMHLVRAAFVTLQSFIRRPPDGAQALVEPAR